MTHPTPPARAAQKDDDRMTDSLLSLTCRRCNATGIFSAGHLAHASGWRLHKGEVLCGECMARGEGRMATEREQIERLRRVLIEVVPFGIGGDGYECLACGATNYQFGHKDERCPIGRATSAFFETSEWFAKQEAETAAADTEPR